MVFTNIFTNCNSVTLLIFEPNNGNFISLQVFEGKSKIIEFDLKSPYRAMTILYPYRFLRLNPKLLCWA